MARLDWGHAIPHLPSMCISLRPATIADEDFLLRLYASTRQEEISAWGWGPAQQAAFIHMQFAAQRQGYSAEYAGADHLLIFWEQQPVGRMIVHRTEKELRLVDIAIFPEHQNRGVGTEMIRNLIRESELSGRPLRLQVVKGNRAAGLYERLGFSKVAEDEIYSQMEWNCGRGVNKSSDP